MSGHHGSWGISSLLRESKHAQEILNEACVDVNIELLYAIRIQMGVALNKKKKRAVE